jgi:hypothetical protein
VCRRRRRAKRYSASTVHVNTEPAEASIGIFTFPDPSHSSHPLADRRTLPIRTTIRLTDAATMAAGLALGKYKVFRILDA